MKTKEEILAWLDKQPWKYEFYEAMFHHEKPKRVYNESFLIYAFLWGATVQGEDIWSKRNKEYQKWYNSNSKPMSWEEYCKQSPIKEDDWFISGACELLKCNGKRERGTTADINIMSKELCEAFLAYMKLIQLRNAWVNTYDDANVYYRIMSVNDQITILSFDYYIKGLSFPTRRIADEFAETFRELLNIAKPLL